MRAIALVLAAIEAAIDRPPVLSETARVTEALGLGLSLVSLGLSATTAWLTLWRRGTIKLAQPPSVYFGPDGAREVHPKVFLRGLLYSTAIRPRIIEGMYVRLRRGDSVQSFPVWVCGDDKGSLQRGAGLAVGPDGAALHHHFLLPADGTTFQFLAGTYVLEIFAVLVGRRTPLALKTLALTVTDPQAAALSNDLTRGLYFDWSPETGRFTSHLDNARLRGEPRQPFPE